MSKHYFKIIFWTGFLIWFIGSWIGGWQKEAQTAFEGYTDTIGGVFMLYGGLGDVFRNLKIVKDESVTINTDKVQVKKGKS